jgi:transposase
MSELKLGKRERLQLETLISGPQDVRLVRRAYALLWLNNGDAVTTVAARLSVSRQTVYAWVDRFQARTADRLKARLADAPRSGRPRTVTGVVDPWIEGVIETDPRQLGYHATVWTAPLLVCYLADHHQLTVSCQSVRLAIARLRLRWKRPRHQLALRSATWRQAKGG